MSVICTACAPQQQQYSASGYSGSASKSAKGAHVGHHVAPPEACPADEVPLEPAPVPATAAPVTVTPEGDRFGLETRGAPAGVVIAELSKAADKPIVALGVGATVPVYARVGGQPLDALLEQIGESVGLHRVDEGSTIVMTDPSEAVRLRRQRIGATAALHAVESRLLETKQADTIAPLVAWTTSSCRGDVIAVPSREWLVIRDDPDRLAAAEAWVAWADAEECAPIEASFEADRRVTWGVADATQPSCGSLAPPTEATGTPVGALVLDATADADVVVGCGSDRLVHAGGRVGPEGFDALGLRAVGSGIYTALPVPEPRAESLMLRSFQSSNPGELQALIAHAFGPETPTYVYWPHNALLVAASGATMEAIAALIERYEAAGR